MKKGFTFHFKKARKCYCWSKMEVTKNKKWIELPYPKNPANTCTWYTETLDSCFDLIKYHQQCIPWSLLLHQQPQKAEPKLYHWTNNPHCTQETPNSQKIRKFFFRRKRIQDISIVVWPSLRTHVSLHKIDMNFFSNRMQHFWDNSFCNILVVYDIIRMILLRSWR